MAEVVGDTAARPAPDPSTPPQVRRAGLHQRLGDLWASPVAVLVVWVVTRSVVVMMGLEHLPYPRNDVLYNDVELYTAWSDRLATGSFPADDPMWQYPPLAGLVFLVPRFTPVGTYVGFVWLALLADLLIQLVLLSAGRRAGRLSGAWTWAVAALVIGPIMWGRFDVIPTLFAVLAVVAAGRPAWSGAWAAVGAALKVWPAVLLVSVPRRHLPSALLSFTLTAGAILVAGAVWGAGSLSFLTFQAARGLQVESLAALPYLVANAMQAPVSRAYQYGAMEITTPGAKDAATALAVIGLLLLAVLIVQRLLGRLERVPAADVALAAVLVSVATSRVLSPQYTVWLLGLGALCVADPRSRLRIPVLLVAVAAVITQPLYPLWYGDLLQGEWYAVLAQSARLGLILAATVIAVIRVMVRPGRYALAAGARTDGRVDQTPDVVRAQSERATDSV